MKSGPYHQLPNPLGGVLCFQCCFSVRVLLHFLSLVTVGILHSGNSLDHLLSPNPLRPPKTVAAPVFLSLSHLLNKKPIGCYCRSGHDQHLRRAIQWLSYNNEFCCSFWIPYCDSFRWIGDGTVRSSIAPSETSFAVGSSRSSCHPLNIDLRVLHLDLGSTSRRFGRIR